MCPQIITLVVLCLAKFNQASTIYQPDTPIPAGSQLYSRQIGLGQNFGRFGFGNHNFGSFGSNGYFNGFGGLGFINGQDGQQGYVKKNEYDVEDQKVKEEDYKKAYGINNQNNGFAAHGYNDGIVAVKDNKADSGFYKGETGHDKQSGENKEYYDSKHLNEEGKRGEENNAKKGFKKGYSTKGFKTSSNKNEEEKSETFFDEAHDEAEDAHYKGKTGSYGEKGHANSKGGEEHAVYNKEGKGEKGGFEKASVLDQNKGEKAQFQQQAHVNNNAAYGVNSGAGAQSILGHQEGIGGEKYYAQKRVPIYGGY